jgi:o-succinylbenzoate synthase
VASSSASVPPLVALRWRAYSLPLARVMGSATGALAERRGIVLELRGAEGARGLGEAAPYPGLSAETIEQLDDLIASDGERLLDPQIDLTTLPPSLACGVDTALLDLVARRHERPVAAVLDDEPASDVEVNAVIGDGSAVEVNARAEEAAEAGYRVLKLKVGGDEPIVDVARIAAARAGAPNARLRLDANGAWSLEVARAMLAATAQQQVELIEQPVEAGQIEQLTSLRGTSRVRTAADESMLIAPAEVIQRQAADAVVLKPMLLGGPRIAMALARLASGSGLQTIVTSTFESSIGTAAALHLAAAIPERGGAHGLSTAAHLAADIVEAPLVPAGGRLSIGAPGLGVRIDEAALNAVALGPWRELAA